MRYALGTSVGERGQITIEPGIREQLGIKPKDIAVQSVKDGRLVPGAWAVLAGPR